MSKQFCIGIAEIMWSALIRVHTDSVYFRSVGTYVPITGYRYSGLMRSVTDQWQITC